MYDDIRRVGRRGSEAPTSAARCDPLAEQSPRRRRRDWRGIACGVGAVLVLLLLAAYFDRIQIRWPATTVGPEEPWPASAPRVAAQAAPPFDYLAWLQGRAVDPAVELPEGDRSALERWQQQQRQEFSRRFVFPYEGEVTVRELAQNRSAADQLRREWHVELHGRRLFRFFELRPVTGGERPLPALVVFMGHGKVRQLFDRDSYQRGAAVALMQLGYAVYVMENVGMGPGDEAKTHRQLDEILSSSGYGWYSLLFAHQQLLLRHVFDQPDVDPTRVGTAGVSTGGLLALTAAAMEPRVRAASVHGIFSSLADSFGRDHARHCACGTIDGLYPEFDLPRLALLIAPRALHVNNNESDTFPPGDAKRALRPFQLLQQRLGGRPAHFTSPPGKHSFALEQAQEFFLRAVPPGP